jgi:hypothetical protein
MEIHIKRTAIAVMTTILLVAPFLASADDEDDHYNQAKQYTGQNENAELATRNECMFLMRECQLCAPGGEEIGSTSRPCDNDTHFITAPNAPKNCAMMKRVFTRLNAWCPRAGFRGSFGKNTSLIPDEKTVAASVSGANAVTKNSSPNGADNPTAKVAAKKLRQSPPPEKDCERVGGRPLPAGC